MRNFGLLLLSLALGIGCGKKSKNSGSITDFTKNDLIQFKSATGLGVSGTRYDLILGKKTIKKYTLGSGGTLQEDRSLTMSDASKSSLSSKLKNITVAPLGQCAESICKSSRPSVWMELPNAKPPAYFFSNEGDCSCEDDRENAPTLQYGQMNTIYKEILALFNAG